MLKKISLILAVLSLVTGVAHAAVDVNNADQAALDSIAGIGPSTSRAIIDERNKHGNFKDWIDLEQRVKGIGERNAVKLSAAGLVVNGQPRPATAAGTRKAGSDSGEKIGKADKTDKTERAEKAGKMDKTEKAARPAEVMKAGDTLK